MKAKLLLRSGVATLICVCGFMGCSQSLAPILTPTYFIVPDSIVAQPFTELSFALHTTDLSAQTYKYVWDYGDSTGNVILNSDVTSHEYYQGGKFKVKASVYDPQSQLLGTASAIVVMPTIGGQVSLNQQSVALDNDTTVLLIQASVTPDSLSANVFYFWSIDDTLFSQSQGRDTISHIFTAAGTHKIKVTASYDGFISLGSDSAIVTVTLPTVTISDLLAMNNISVSLSGPKGSFSLMLPLTNGMGYSLTQNNNSILAGYQSRYHQQVNSTTVVDSLRTRAIGVTLKDNRHASLDVASLLDSFFIATPRQDIKHYLQESFSGGTLELVQKSADSIVFRWSVHGPYSYFGGYSYAAVDTTFDPTTISNTGGNGCGNIGVVPVSIIGQVTQFELQTIVFRKQ